MGDLELLKLAAKAVDDPSINETRVWDGCQFWVEQDGQIYTWNPLIDDGDAFRLAVIIQKHMPCEFILYFCADCTYADAGDGKDIQEFNNPDAFAATRRAIVRAAAKIGESK